MVPTGKPAGKRPPRPEFVAAAVDDQAHAVAGHGDRYRVVGVGQQQHGGGAPGDADHLAHQAAGIDHRLPDMHAFAAAGVEHQPLLHRVQVDVQHRCQLHIQATALGHVQQFAQLGGVQRGGRQAGQARVGQQQLVAQPASAHTGCTRRLAGPRSCASQPAWSSSTIRVMASAR
ncbi:hypothetical protein G6F50_015093 [Rhizopus delemar]|uniref:Uncharacterized protein n=1 Tax=Rhizopus delemar TaxID=936053 RepID=A0A9P7C5P7_9FUNG|nr:hypothetical protein G6F50_015093 [Rhizopus delemar]